MKLDARRMLGWAVVGLLWVGCGDSGSADDFVVDASADATADSNPADSGLQSDADAVGVADVTGDSAAADAAADSNATLDGNSTDSESDGASDVMSDATGDATDAEQDAQPDAVADAGPDAGPDAVADADAGPKEECEDGPPSIFDYGCSLSAPSSCPDGICLFGICLGPVLDPNRWADCGDALCDPCETADTCPADCAAPPVIAPAVYDSPNTISVWIHGFRNVSDAEFEQKTYGSYDGCSGVFSDIADFGVQRPCATDPDNGDAPNHYAKVEYFGAIPAAWLSEDDIAEIEALDWHTTEALARYALISAKFIRWRVSVSGADAVNLSCHSMGCLITRYIIEHDLEQLASDGLLARWVSSAGVVAGARLARLYDNPTVQQSADALGLGVNEFAFMNPDFVMDYAARWDHRLYEGNSPYFQNIAIHHHTGSDPHIASAFNIQLLDLDNPGDEPNDGIMFTLDEYFHSQSDTGAFVTAQGQPLPATHSTSYIDHEDVPETDAFVALAAAGLFHNRRVRVVLEEVELFDDFETENLIDGQHGLPPAELFASVEVRYDPYTISEFGKSVLVHEAKRAHRTAELFVAEQGAIASPELALFEGPVFDQMESFILNFGLMEADWYPRFGVLEWALDPDELVASYVGSVPIENGAFEVNNGKARMVIRVEVHSIHED